MDVHGTKLVRTLFTIATGVKTAPPNKGMELTSQKRHALCKKKGARRVATQLSLFVRAVEPLGT